MKDDTVAPAKKCFVVSPIGSINSEARRRSDGFLREVIRPVAEKLGYVVERADEDKAPGMVTEGIVNKIIDADLVIVDLHGHNPNVMYEVAVRHATDKPLVQMIENGEALPFDIGGINTIFYDASVMGLQAWRDDLSAAISASGTHTGASNPIVRAGLMRTLGKQNDSSGEMQAMLFAELAALRTEMRVVTERSSRTSSTAFVAPELTPNRVLLVAEQFVQADLTSYVNSRKAFSDYHFVFTVTPDQIVITAWNRTKKLTANLRYSWDRDNVGLDLANIKNVLELDVRNAIKQASSEYSNALNEHVNARPLDE